MARILDWSPQQVHDWETWFRGRPGMIQSLAQRFPPYNLYRLKSTGQRCTIYSYNEGGTLTVAVTGQWNQVMFDRHVFGVAPENLEEAELPGPDELHGTVLTDPEEIATFVNLTRPAVLRGRQSDGEEIP